ncbi:hypothetical protein BLOT_013743 [Blomia tropicalis]|nr:hypothetical protein BLOT_013743 [Blomia tropicalis]
MEANFSRLIDCSNMNPQAKSIDNDLPIKLKKDRQKKVTKALIIALIQKYQTKLDRLICKYRTFRSKQNYGRMVHFVPIVISEHFRYVQLKYLINDELLSNYLWVAFITNLPTSIYLITKVIMNQWNLLKYA